ncbi:MAG: sulfatase-like hydrolase/transferase, partial [Saprospiraceae bacterium]|nr:sulfatase-like hydrolase/transferase [Saprospiraceae bacterium]
MPVCHKILLALLLGLPLKVYPQSDRPLPNIIVVFIDDMGFGDVSIHQPSIDYTPNFQYLADHGVVMNHFYVSESVCTASRSSLLTGCYANRVGMGGAIDHSSQFGLNPEETTMAEMLRSRGYKTAAIGKWHLGFQQPFLPTSQGFDEFFGIPYSNDMWPHHPQTPGYYPPLPLYKNETVIDTVREQSWFTQTFTDKAIDFIRRRQDQPFFLYLAHPLPHVPLFVSKTYRGSTGKGLYADVIHEIDATIGQLLESLRIQHLEENTLLIVTSDNGPWLAYGNHSGTTAGLREGKGTSWEGGVRVPFVAYWKGVLPQNVRVNQEAMTIDLLPTLAHLTGADLPQRKTDGVNLWPVLSGAQEKLPDRPLFFYYNRNDLEAMRWKQWKLYFPHAYRTMEGQPQGLDGQPGQYRNVRMGAPELYDLLTDPSEQSNVVRNYAAIADTMQQMAEAMRLELGDDLRGMAGRENRSAGIFRDSPHPPIPFWDATLPFEKRADDVLTRLSLDEKVQQLMHRAPEIKRLGIPAYNWWNEALHGVARTKYTTTVFPQAIGMAATWDTS